MIYKTIFVKILEEIPTRPNCDKNQYQINISSRSIWFLEKAKHKLSSSPHRLLHLLGSGSQFLHLPEDFPHQYICKNVYFHYHIIITSQTSWPWYPLASFRMHFFLEYCRSNSTSYVTKSIIVSIFHIFATWEGRLLLLHPFQCFSVPRRDFSNENIWNARYLPDTQRIAKSSMPGRVAGLGRLSATNFCA